MLLKSIIRVLRNQHFWYIVIIFTIGIILHYPQQTPISWNIELRSFIGLERHALVRILFLAPIIYAAFMFGIKGGIISLIAASLVMLPRVFFISLYPMDALFETFITIAVGVLINLWLESRRREMGRREQAMLKLEATKRELESHIQLIRENERRISAAHSIADMINRSIMLEEILDVATDKIKEVTDIDAVLILLMNEESEQLELKTHRGIYKGFASEINELIKENRMGDWLINAKEPYFVEDTSKDPIFSQGVMRKEGLKSLFIVPLKSKDKAMGTLCVATRAPKQLTSDEKKLLVLIGSELGVATEKAFFLQELQRIGRRFQEIFEKAHDAIWIQDLSGKIIIANRAASILTEYELEKLTGKDISGLFKPEGLKLSREVEQDLLSGKEVKQPYEQKMVKKNGTAAILMITTSLLGDEKTPAFLNIARDITDERRLQESLRLYTDQISKAHEEERKRIARELHDDTIQTMVSILRRLDNFISKNLAIQAETLKPIKEIQRNIDESLIRIRRFIQYLRPPTLEYLGLLPALRELASQAQEQSGIGIDLRVNGSERHLAPEQELLAYRIIQEAVRNVEKHSKAARAEINIEFDEDNITVIITDHGKGFEVNKSSKLLEKGKLGLMGMKERAHLLGGTLEISSKPNNGTTVTLNIRKKA